MSPFFIGAKNRVLKGEAALKGKGSKGRVITKKQNTSRVIHLNQNEFNYKNQ
ncbi:hypothetical protein HL669_23550 [Vibrio parahaemolyticus]|uniref:hypothetical protein n=1 Tax=Vibrio parahaemolyticus TaxID=670 RepID=UPI0014851D10|nr:hypothetical protein [Vibrio parahaemolyticus]ELB2105286.1 hypothetical protein [Vibrio parahaemolyticus]NNU14573.1 hypothetical protein [Vibrio parahaemolyticus]